MHPCIASFVRECWGQARRSVDAMSDIDSADCSDRSVCVRRVRLLRLCLVGFALLQAFKPCELSPVVWCGSARPRPCMRSSVASPPLCPGAGRGEVLGRCAALPPRCHAPCVMLSASRSPDARSRDSLSSDLAAVFAATRAREGWPGRGRRAPRARPPGPSATARTAGGGGPMALRIYAAKGCSGSASNATAMRDAGWAGNVQRSRATCLAPPIRCRPCLWRQRLMPTSSVALSGSSPKLSSKLSWPRS